jgi:hypothetical protein
MFLNFSNVSIYSSGDILTCRWLNLFLLKQVSESGPNFCQQKQRLAISSQSVAQLPDFWYQIKNQQESYELWVCINILDWI